MFGDAITKGGNGGVDIDLKADGWVSDGGCGHKSKKDYKTELLLPNCRVKTQSIYWCSFFFEGR